MIVTAAHKSEAKAARVKTASPAERATKAHLARRRAPQNMFRRKPAPRDRIRTAEGRQK